MVETAVVVVSSAPWGQPQVESGQKAVVDSGVMVELEAEWPGAELPVGKPSAEGPTSEVGVGKRVVSDERVADQHCSRFVSC